SLEIAHGPQSTLYGGEAVGGVISLRSLRGRGTSAGRVSLEAGSFGTLQGAAALQGEQGPWAYNVAVQGGRTDNDRINNDFESGNVTVRLDRTVNERISVGATVRGFQGIYGSPGTRFSNDPDNEERESNWLSTVFADVRHADQWNTHVVLGGQLRRFVSENPGRTGTSITVVKNRRAVLDWQTTYEGIENHRITGGFTAEANHTRNTGFGDIDEGQSLLAFFLQDEITPVEQVQITVGLRHDDFDTFGRHTTGKASVAWNVLPGRIKVRASGGTAFRSPSFLDLYGDSAFYVGNPNLKPERARGGDIGLDYSLPENRGTVSVTWFENRFKDLIVSDFSRNPSSVANVDRASTRGAELSFLIALPRSTQLRSSYTYLEAENDQTHRRLLRRPRHIGNVDVSTDFGRGVTAGAGLRVVAQREDVHAGNFATIDGEDYSVVRVYAAWAVNERLILRARVENLLDESYEEVHGFPQLPVGGFASLEWRW
ncbi:MAG TPA: TonB-dependent receptor, partial [Opitutaceae bacterium]|nr:TonB-dependent receptor [Opitutaceae bacterium]